MIFLGLRTTLDNLFRFGAEALRKSMSQKLLNAFKAGLHTTINTSPWDI